MSSVAVCTQFIRSPSSCTDTGLKYARGSQSLSACAAAASWLAAVNAAWSAAPVNTVVEM